MGGPFACLNVITLHIQVNSLRFLSPCSLLAGRKFGDLEHTTDSAVDIKAPNIDSSKIRCETSMGEDNKSPSKASLPTRRVSWPNKPDLSELESSDNVFRTPLTTSGPAFDSWQGSASEACVHEVGPEIWTMEKLTTFRRVLPKLHEARLPDAGAAPFSVLTGVLTQERTPIWRTCTEEASIPDHSHKHGPNCGHTAIFAMTAMWLSSMTATSATCTRITWTNNVHGGPTPPNPVCSAHLKSPSSTPATSKLRAIKRYRMVDHPSTYLVTAPRACTHFRMAIKKLRRSRGPRAIA